MYWGSYKATCRRNGSWAGVYGGRDLNVELFAPIDKQLAANWERTFRQRIPSALENYSRRCSAFLSCFHKNVTEKVPGAAANPAGLIMLGQQMQTYQTTLKATPDFLHAKITETQREANRGFTRVIRDAMQPAYYDCARERGTGTFERMKFRMEDHVATVRDTMFRQACDDVKGQLNVMYTRVEQCMIVSMRNVLAKLQRDYRTTILGGRPGATGTATAPFAEQVLQSQVRPILEDADSRFAQFVFAAGGEVPVAAVGSEQ